MHRTVSLVTTAFCVLFASAAASAQEPYSPLVPRGKIRLDARGLYASFSDQYGGLAGGSATLGNAFSGSVGTGTFPFLTATESVVNSILDEPWTLSLGAISSVVEKSTASVPLALDVGVFDWLTVGAVVPLVGNETEFTLHFTADSTAANAGFNPALDSEVLVASFLNGLNGTIGAYDAYRDATCRMDPSSPACTGAVAVLEEARAFERSLSLLYGEMFAPVAWSPAGAALQARLASLTEAFEAAGVTGPSTVPLSTTALTAEDLQALVTDPRYGIAATYPLAKWRSVWQLGDVEVRADARLVETGDPQAASRITAGAGAVLRMPTGSQDDPANFLDTGSGDGQWDVEFRGWMNGQWRSVFGLWADLRYGAQIGGTAERRVFDPSVTFAPLASQIRLDWDPGDYQSIELSPWYRISGGLTALVGYRFLHRGEDSFALRADPEATAPATPPDPDILVAGTGFSASQLMLGMVYNRAGAEHNGVAGDPLEIRLVYRRVLGGSWGAVPRESSLEVGFRLFRGIWGG